MLDDVIALIRSSRDAEQSTVGPDHRLLDIDPVQATYILDTQLRRLAAMERQKTIDRLAELERQITDPQERPGQARAAARDHLGQARRDRRQVRRRAQDEIISADGDLSDEDLIPDEDLVVTITHGGYAKHQGRPVPHPTPRWPWCPWGVAARRPRSGTLFATTSHH